MASATKTAGFNNQTIQQPRLQQPAKPDSTTKTQDSTTTIFNNQGFNNQISGVQSATEWIASVHTLHMPKPNATRVQNGLLRYILYTCPNLM